MTRGELRALADWLDRQLPYGAHRAAAFLRLIADEQPVAWRDPETDGLSRVGRVGWQPLYTLPLEEK